MKKTFSVFLALIFLLSAFSINSLAAENDTSIKETCIIINEWDEYKRLTSMTDDELQENGFTLEKIEEIRNFDYEGEIRKTAKLDDKTLLAYGYTDKEIIALREAASMEDIPENVIKSISTSTMTSVVRYVSNGSRNEAGITMYYVNLKYSWSWNRVPLVKFIDTVAIAYASNTGYDFSYCIQSGNSVRADFQPIYPGYTTIPQAKSWQYSIDKTNCIYANLGLQIKDEDGLMTHFAYDGYGTFQLTNRSNCARLRINACYGHTIVNIVPDFSVGISSISPIIDFELGIDEQHCVGEFYENFTIASNYIYDGTIYGKNNTGGTAA